KLEVTLVCHSVFLRDLNFACSYSAFLCRAHLFNIICLNHSWGVLNASPLSRARSHCCFSTVLNVLPDLDFQAGSEARSLSSFNEESKSP
uniref:Ovule protein n=2 Tax=Mesocestoides corti TaxID=53468 RepID=A0A5K3FLG3_MESCO